MRSRRVCVNWGLMKGGYSYPVNELGLYVCPNKCGRLYKVKGSLTKHLKLECGVAPQFRCRLCLKSFKQKVTLKAHLVSVHGEVPD